MKPLEQIAFALATAVLVGCFAFVSGSADVRPLLSPAPSRILVWPIMALCGVSGGALTWAITSGRSTTSEAQDRAFLQSAALAVTIIAVVVMLVCAWPSDDPAPRLVGAILLVLASVAALRCYDALARGEALGFESHWGGLGSGAGGWRILPAAALALMALSFTGAAVTLILHAPPKGTATLKPEADKSASPPGVTPSTAPAKGAVKPGDGQPVASKKDLSAAPAVSHAAGPASR